MLNSTRKKVSKGDKTMADKIVPKILIQNFK